MPAANPLYEAIPRHTSFQIGRDLDPSQAFDPLVGIVKREGVLEVVNPAAQPNPPVRIVLLCMVSNFGTAPFTIQCEQSANNNSTGVNGLLTPDAYADVAIRVDGNAVANGEITVVPGGRQVFLIEWFEGVDDYLQFLVPTEGAFGELVLSHFNGTLVIRERSGQP